MRKQLILIFLFTINFFYAQSEWYYQNPLPVGSPLRSVAFSTDSVGYIIDINNRIYRSTDIGKTWTKIIIEEASGKSLYKIYFTSKKQGWILGDGLLLKTIDGGISWSRASIPTTAALRLQTSLGKNIWILGDLVLLRSTDYGNSWEKIFIPTKEEFYIKDICFTDENNGWAISSMSSGNILQTSNGGKNWTIIKTIVITDELPLNSIGFFDSNNGIISFGSSGSNSSSAKILKTSDGGKTWDLYDLGLTASNLEKITILNQQNICYISSYNGDLIQSIDKGETWNDISIPGCYSIFDIVFNQDNAGWIVSYNGDVFFSDLGGIIWHKIHDNIVGAILHEIKFINSTIGYAADGYGYILKTTDAGYKWRKINIAPNSYCYSISFVNENIGWVVGEGKVYKTTDGGSKWVTKTNGLDFPGEYINWDNVTFVDSLTGWVGGHGKVVHTTDGGNNWVTQLSVGPSYNVKVFFINNDNGWAATSSGRFYKTSNGGQQWVQKTDFIYYKVDGLFFLNNNLGWAVGSDKIFRTTDGGENWSYQISPVYGANILKSVFFANEMNGWIVGAGGRILGSTDGGNTWQPQSTPTGNDLESVHFIDKDNGWAVGWNSTILHTKGGGIFTNISSNEIVQLPKKIELFQNYPNPFNPSTTISYEIPKNSFVILEVYDILGRKVETLVQEQKTIGNYTVEFNANKHSSGIYFYTLRIKDFIRTKKMILIR